MSDTPQSEGWWLASDGKWYPPQSPQTQPQAASSLRPDIAAAAAHLPNTFGSKREIRKLAEHLWEGERVEQLTKGSYGKGTGIPARTDRRLLFLVDGWTGAKSEDFPFSKISSVQWTSGVLMGTITIFASGSKAEIKNVPKQIGKGLVDAVRAVISDLVSAAPAQAGDDVMEQLRKLGGLHDAGIVTDAEFEAKKAKLLSRL